ncbi:cupin domain-containing protein, partial [Escherichia coli]
LIIIQTKDALLVSTHKSVQDVKEIVEILKKEGRCEYHSHREIFRPWGKYDSIDSGERYQIKRITVSPGESLSLQIHYHRAEHWIILSGTALITLGKEERILCENQSIYIPQGVEHSLANPGKIPLELVEVRSGAYIEEDDIIRIADKYGRT